MDWPSFLLWRRDKLILIVLLGNFLFFLNVETKEIELKKELMYTYSYFFLDGEMRVLSWKSEGWLSLGPSEFELFEFRSKLFDSSDSSHGWIKSSYWISSLIC